jgi:putative addiction module component (TIGR02574 family)
LVEDIWDSIAADSAALPLTDVQRDELDRRQRCV